MNRDFELISFLKQPVRAQPKRWTLSTDFSKRFIYKSYGGRGKGRWHLFRSEELSPHKPFSDALVSTLFAEGLLTSFCRENSRAFFLKEEVPCTPYEMFKTIEVYKRALK